jgi:hypothetical protein
VTAAAGKGPLYDEKFDEGLWAISSARFGGFIPGQRLVVSSQQSSLLISASRAFSVQDGCR